MCLRLGGLRFGEAAALRGRCYDPTLEPRGRLLVAVSWSTTHRVEKGTKTEQPRAVPVQPVLAKILAAWKLGGYKAFQGRSAGADDLLVPSLLSGFRSRARIAAASASTSSSHLTSTRCERNASKSRRRTRNKRPA